MKDANAHRTDTKKLFSHFRNEETCEESKY